MGKDCIEAIYGLMGWKGLNAAFHNIAALHVQHIYSTVDM